MVSTLSSFQTHIASIMETLVQTAVLEISRLVDVEFEVLLSEVTRSRSEISELKKRLSLTEVQPWTNTGPTLTQSFTGVKSEYAQEEMHNHLKRCSVEVLFRDSPTVIQQDQDSPQQKYEVSQPISMIKQEIHEVDVWIGQDKEAETHCDEAISMSTTKDVLETVPCVDRNREHAAARVPSKSEPLELNRNDLPGEMMVQSLSMKCTYESENPSFSHTQSLSASKSTRTSSDNTISWDKRLVCTYCSKWFKCFSQLKIHQRSHTGEKPYRCTLCGKQYIQKGHLYTHQRTHTGEKPYRCAVCGKGFIQKCTLDMHLRSHTGEKPYTCIKCGKGFTTKFNLNKHLSCLSCNNIS